MLARGSWATRHLAGAVPVLRDRMRVGEWSKGCATELRRLAEASSTRGAPCAAGVSGAPSWCRLRSSVRRWLRRSRAELLTGATTRYCHPDLNRFRSRYVQNLLEQEMGELSEIERSVVERITERETLATNVDERLDEKETLGERVADRGAEFGGSWRFIGLFAFVMIGWMALNTLVLAGGFDPSPSSCSISCCPASPRSRRRVIMMSQNRQEFARPRPRRPRLHDQPQGRARGAAPA